MKQYECEKIRNVAVVGSGGSGKTSLLESLLFSAGASTKIGSIQAGNTASDYDPEEIKRQISIHASLFPVEFSDHKINLIDTPGYSDFIGEVACALSAVEGLVFVFDAVSGVGVGSDTIWKMADERKIPRIVVINRMDRDRADFWGTLESIRNKFGKHLVPVAVPVGEESGFSGIVDVMNMKAYSFEKGKSVETPLSPEMNESASKGREMLLEDLSEFDDTLLEEYLEGKEISLDEILSDVKKGIIDGKVVPVVCSSSTKNIGVSNILSYIAEFLPSPLTMEHAGVDPSTDAEASRRSSSSEPFSGYIFKTVTEPHVGELSYLKIYSGKLAHSTSVYNSTKKAAERIGQIITMFGKNRVELAEGQTGDIVVLPKLKNTSAGDTLCDQKAQIEFKAVSYPEPVISLAVKPKSKGDQEKLGLAFNSFSHEDKTFKVQYDPETKETVIFGMGDVHLEIMLERLKSRYGVEVETGVPKIPYKETIRGAAKAQGKYKKQTGGRGQYGDTWLELEPLARGRGFEFVNKIVGGAIPKNYIPSVEKGIVEAMATGVIAGYPVIDIKATLFDGSYHEVDSSDMAFKIAGSMGFKKAFEEAKPVILEPYMNVEVVIPQEYVGDVSGDISKRRGKILGMDPMDGMDKILGIVPLAELSKYASDLRSMSHGRGSFTMKFSHYQEVVAKTQAELIAEYQARKEKGRGQE